MKIPRTVIYLGLASLFSDIASEAVYPLLPLFLIGTLGASASFLGALEGFVEATSALMKIFAGYLSDRMKKKKALVLLGYGISNLLRPLLAISQSAFQVLAIRFGDRIGKGIRTAPRDAWLAAHTSPQTRGRIFGFHRGMDHAGATIAPILASLFLILRPEDYRGLFAWTILPGLIAIAFVYKAKSSSTKELPELQQESKVELSSLKLLSKTFWVLLVILFVFTLAQATEVFLLLKLKESGVRTMWIPLIWAGHNAIKMLSSFWGGELADRVGSQTAIKLGWALFCIVYFLLAMTQDLNLVIALLLIYGFYYGLTESAEKSLIAQLSPTQLHGTAFGLYHLILGFGALPGGILFGMIWDRWGSSPAFLAAGTLGSLACLLFLGFTKTQKLPSL